MGKIFDTDYAFLGYCKGILKNKGYSHFVDDNSIYFKGLCTSFFNLNKYSYKLEERNLIGMTDILIKSLIEVKCPEDISTIHKIIEILAKFISDDNPCRENYPDLYPRFEQSQYMMSQSYVAKTEDEKGNINTSVFTLTDEFLKSLNYLDCKFGVYIFLNELKEPVYVGKSKDLAGRIPQSFTERNYPPYVKYAETKTKSDMCLYEIYYITKYKPLLNTESNYDDSLTVELPELDFSEVIKTRNTRILDKVDNLDNANNLVVSDGISSFILPENLKYKYIESQDFISEIKAQFESEYANPIIDKACYKVPVRCLDGKGLSKILIVDFDRLYTIFRLFKLDRYFELVIYKKYKHNIKYFAHENMWTYYGFDFDIRNTETLKLEYDEDMYEIIDIGKQKKLIKLSDMVDINIELDEENFKIPNYVFKCNDML